MSETTAAAGNKYVLLRPITFEDQEIKELTLDFDSLSGADLIQAERLAARIPGYSDSFVKPANTLYQVCVAAQAAKVVPELITALKAKDFGRVTMSAANFLVTSE